MDIPSVNQLSQLPGGAVWNVFKELGMGKNALENAYYGPNIESEMGLRNANTKRINQLLPGEVERQGLENKYYAPNILSEIGLRHANTNHLNTMTPLEAQARRIANQYLGKEKQAALQQADLDNVAKWISNQYLEKEKVAALNQANAHADYYKQGGAGLGTGAKEQRFFQNAVAMDNPQLQSPDQIYEAANALAQGRSQLSDGTKLNPLSPLAQASLNRLAKGQTTAALTTQSVKANQADAELKVLNKYATDGLKPYGDTLFGKSPQQIKDSFKSDTESQKRLGRFYGSQALQYEAAQIRNRLAGGEPGISATQELMGKSAQIVDSLNTRMTGEARAEAIRYIDEALEKGLEARNKVGIGAGQLNYGAGAPNTGRQLENNESIGSNTASKALQNEADEIRNRMIGSESGKRSPNISMVQMRAPDGRIMSIPEKNVTEAEKRGAKRIG